MCINHALFENDAYLQTVKIYAKLASIIALVR